MEVPLQFNHNLPTLALVYGDRGVEEGGLVVVLAGDGAQGRNVLWEARAAPADPGAQEAAPDALVQTNAGRDVRNVGTDQLADPRDLVYKADLGSQKSVGRVLDHLRARQVRRHERHRGLGPRVHLCREGLLDDRLVQRPHGVQGVPLVRPKYDAVWEQRIVDRAPLS